MPPSMNRADVKYSLQPTSECQGPCFPAHASPAQYDGLADTFGFNSPFTPGWNGLDKVGQNAAAHTPDSEHKELEMWAVSPTSGVVPQPAQNGSTATPQLPTHSRTSGTGVVRLNWAEMIYHTIWESPGGRLVIQDLFEGMCFKFPEIREWADGKDWEARVKNRIKSTLSIKGTMFVKVPRPSTASGKGSWWMLTPEAQNAYRQGRVAEMIRSSGGSSHGQNRSGNTTPTSKHFPGPRLNRFGSQDGTTRHSPVHSGRRALSLSARSQSSLDGAGLGSMLAPGQGGGLVHPGSIAPRPFGSLPSVKLNTPGSAAPMAPLTLSIFSPTATEFSDSSASLLSPAATTPSFASSPLSTQASEYTDKGPYAGMNSLTFSYNNLAQGALQGTMGSFPTGDRTGDITASMNMLSPTSTSTLQDAQTQQEQLWNRDGTYSNAYGSISDKALSSAYANSTTALLTEPPYFNTTAPYGASLQPPAAMYTNGQGTDPLNVYPRLPDGLLHVPGLAPTDMYANDALQYLCVPAHDVNTMAWMGMQPSSASQGHPVPTHRDPAHVIPAEPHHAMMPGPYPGT